MEALVFFTQYNGLGKLSIIHDNLNFIDSKVLEFSGNIPCYLVSDEISEASLKNELFTSLRNKIELRKIYYVKHRNPSNEIILSFETFCKESSIDLIPYDDQHEPETSKYYKFLGGLDFQNFLISNKLIDVLLKQLGGDPILEAKLELLHNCFIPEDIPGSLPQLLSKFTTDFETFKTSIKDKKFSDKGYLEALTTFKDKLLPF
jgi:hypothetical protein